ncbi:hypothetical protein J4410_04940 [Candidatus Woesearchaeota archaeon]|nr:hypothetical protein [Candidatus Woesearchaeota archaeon]
MCFATLKHTHHYKDHCLGAKPENDPIYAGSFSRNLRSTEQPSYAMITRKFENDNKKEVNIPKNIEK